MLRKKNLLLFGALFMLVSTGVWADEIKGRVKSVTKYGVAMEVENRGVVVLKFDAATRFRNTEGAKDLVVDEVLVVTYTADTSGNLAQSVSKFIAPLPQGVERIGAEELLALVNGKSGGYTLIDSRPLARYNERHIPTAVSLPLPVLEKQGEKALPADKSRLLVFYCGGLSCGLSPKSAQIARAAGYQNVRVFQEGEPAWRKAEYRMEATAEQVKNGNIALIDLRTPEQAEAGYIPRAVNIPMARLGKAEKNFPDYRGAAIVFYSDKLADIDKALETMIDWGYRNAVAYSGGIEAWKKAGNELLKGSVATTIRYQRQFSEGELSIEDFQARLRNNNVLVVDARSKEEFAAGRLPGAVNIPAEEMEKRFSEIATGKELLLYCSSGTRAEMAFDVLREKGVRSSYVKAAITFSRDGKAKFSEPD